jgi:chromosome segregation ATPase
MLSRDVAFRSLIVLMATGCIALIAGIYEVDRREKSTSDTVSGNLRELEHRVELLRDQLRISTGQSSASERQVQVLGHQMQALELRLKDLEDQKSSAPSRKTPP